MSGRLACDLRNDGGQDKEEQSVRRNLKIEIEQAVNEQCEHPAPSSQSRPGHHATSVAGRAQNVARYQEDKPQSKDRKSTRLNSSHLGISYAVFCLKKKKKKKQHTYNKTTVRQEKRYT